MFNPTTFYLGKANLEPFLKTLFLESLMEKMNLKQILQNKKDEGGSFIQKILTHQRLL